MRGELDYVSRIISKSVTDVGTNLEIPIEFVGKFHRASPVSPRLEAGLSVSDETRKVDTREKVDRMQIGLCETK